MIGPLRVAPEANEIAAALELLKILPLNGVTITGDAIFTQRAICQTIIRRLGYKGVEGFEYFAEHRLAAVEAIRTRTE